MYKLPKYRPVSYKFYQILTYERQNITLKVVFLTLAYKSSYVYTASVCVCTRMCVGEMVNNTVINIASN